MDILFFAAIAVFIFFKLREQLGKVDNDQKEEWKKRNSIKNFIKERTKNTNTNSQNNQSKIVSIDGSEFLAKKEIKSPIDQESQKIIDSLEGDLKTNLIKNLEKSNLSASQFLNGAKSAFEIILNSFASLDVKTLKPLLSETVFLQFEGEINNRIKNEQVLNIKIISIDEAKITDAQTIDNFFQVTISFTSKQINNVIKNGNVIAGSETEISTVNDVWTFKKNIHSKNLNWLLSATN
ncbi:MAG: putative lipid-binding transport protein (Tim44 family) [Rickettsiales bacterium]|jgi:predicted lipid-binding transport protein (Tim44 family)